MAIVTAALIAGPVRSASLGEPVVHTPWWLLVALFAVAELASVHVFFRGEAHTLTFTEIPLLLGLYMGSPLSLLAAQAVAAALVRSVVIRQSAAKQAFNGVLGVLDGAVLVLVFDALGGTLDPLSQVGWLAAVTAVAVMTTVSATAVNFAMLLNSGSARPHGWRQTVATGLLVAISNSTLGLAILAVVSVDAAAAAYLILPAATLMVGCRAYLRQRQERQRVDFLLQCSRVLHGRADLGDALVALLELVREATRAGSAEVMLLPGGENGYASRTCVSEYGRPERMAPVAEAELDLLRTAMASGPGVLAQGRDQYLAGYRRARDFADTMVLPLPGEGGALGVLLVANPLGEVSRFTPEHLSLLDALVGQLAPVLQNDTLSRTLSELRRVQSQLEHQVLHDPLTGLANRRLFLDRARGALHAHASGRPIGVVFIDLDDLKSVNDRFGHAAGDSLIQQVAARLSRAVRHGDTVARLGGDEFAVLLEARESTGELVHVAERLLNVVSEPCTVAGESTRTGASVGVAWPQSGVWTVEKLVSAADVAMYRAKSSGKGRVTVFTPTTHASVLDRRRIVDDLRDALDSRALHVAYQPIVSLSTNRVVGVEALARWHDRRRGDVSPAVFIPAAEESGLIVLLGQQVLEASCAALGEWRQAGLATGLRVSVNVSANQLHDPSFVDKTLAALESAAVDARSLVLEITETRLLDNPEGAVQALERLRERGVRIALDDFGTGYSSLSLLRSLPVDVLKIDRSFVRTLSEQESDRELVRAIVSLATSLGVQVVAEGVETPVQARWIRDLGCQLAQGYLYGRPMGAAEMADLLNGPAHNPLAGMLAS